MKTHLTRPSVGQLQRTVTIAAIFMITGSVACIATGQVCEPNAIVAGKGADKNDVRGLDYVRSMTNSISFEIR